ncbi:MAG: hypothetical protein IT178_15355, partial [Acidobacteria bacterium]|nr:hypothetical protein [Acidobacteriota bacterium]
MNGGPEAAASLPAELTPRRSSEPAVRAGAPARSPIEPLMAGLVGLASLLALVLSRDASAAVAVVILGGLLMHAWLAPIRRTLFIAMFLGLAADRPGDTDGHWASPIVDIGGMLFQNLNKVIGIEALKFSGVFLLLAMLLAVRAVRRLERRGGDTPASVLPATPMMASVLAALAAVVVMLVIGMLRGGNVQMAKIQLQGFLQMLAAAYLFSVSLRGPRDYRTAARVIVAAACVKAA